MSSSATTTGDKPSDPYKAKNLDTTPSLEEKVQGLTTFIKNSKFGMMTTRVESRGLLVSRCMSVAGTEPNGLDLLFHTNTTSGKTSDLTSDPSTNISFLNSTTGEWASVSGHSTILTDRDTVRQLYSPGLRAWFGDLGDGVHDGGPEDPRIGVIRVEAKTATYALATGSSLGRGLAMVKGAVTGEAPKVTDLRELGEEEVQEWREKNK